MSKFLPLLALCFCILFISSCGSDDEVISSSVEVASVTPAGPFQIGDDVEILIKGTTDKSVGIQSLKLEQRGFELFFRDDYTSNILELFYETKITLNDLAAGGATFDVTLTDKSGGVFNTSVTLEIQIDYGYIVGEMVPNPSWDLVSNVAVTATAGENVDLTVETSVNNDGGDAIHFVSKNSTTYYDISGTDFDYLDPNFTVEDVETAIAGITPVDSIVYKFNQMDVTRLPLVARLRGGSEYAVIGFARNGFSTWGYKKTSATAGQ